MQEKFEQNHIVQTTQNFELFDKKTKQKKKQKHVFFCIFLFVLFLFFF